MTVSTAETAQTQCPNCRTTLRVEKRFIHAQDSRVRCGQCLFVFSARDHQVPSRPLLAVPISPQKAPPVRQPEPELASGEPAPAQAKAKEASPRPASPWPKADQWSSGEKSRQHDDPRASSTYAELDELSFNDSHEWPQREATAQDFDDALFDPSSTLNSEELAERFTATLSRHQQGLGSKQPATGSAQNDDYDLPESAKAYGSMQPDVPRAPRRLAKGDPDQRGFSDPVMNATSHLLGAWGSAVAGLLFVLVLAVGIIWTNRESLAQSTLMRPVVASLCAVSGCELAPLRDVDAIAVVNRKVYTHPRVNNALVISITMRNDAHFIQPYPGVRVTMSDSRGVAVAERDFSPELYRQEANDGGLMPPGVNVNVTLEVRDPGSRADAFSFTFF